MFPGIVTSNFILMKENFPDDKGLPFQVPEF